MYNRLRLDLRFDNIASWFEKTPGQKSETAYATWGTLKNPGSVSTDKQPILGLIDIASDIARAELSGDQAAIATKTKEFAALIKTSQVRSEDGLVHLPQMPGDAHFFTRTGVEVNSPTGTPEQVAMRLFGKLNISSVTLDLLKAEMVANGVMKPAPVVAQAAAPANGPAVGGTSTAPAAAAAAEATPAQKIAQDFAKLIADLGKAPEVPVQDILMKNLKESLIKDTTLYTLPAKTTVTLKGADGKDVTYTLNDNEIITNQQGMAQLIADKVEVSSEVRAALVRGFGAAAAGAGQGAVKARGDTVGADAEPTPQVGATGQDSNKPPAKEKQHTDMSIVAAEGAPAKPYSGLKTSDLPKAIAANQVKPLQEMLHKAGYDLSTPTSSDGVDGMLGTKTLNALKLACTKAGVDFASLDFTKPETLKSVQDKLNAEAKELAPEKVVAAPAPAPAPAPAATVATVVPKEIRIDFPEPVVGITGATLLTGAALAPEPSAADRVAALAASIPQGSSAAEMLGAMSGLLTGERLTTEQSAAGAAAMQALLGKAQAAAEPYSQAYYRRTAEATGVPIPRRSDIEPKAEGLDLFADAQTFNWAADAKQRNDAVVPAFGTVPSIEQIARNVPAAYEFSIGDVSPNLGLPPKQRDAAAIPPR